jgi:hypothetical protein
VHRTPPSGLPEWLQTQARTHGAAYSYKAQTQGAITAVFIVHEFRTNLTKDTKLEANANAMNSFLRLFYSVNGGPDECLHVRPGEIVGPISIIDRPLAGSLQCPSIPLFIGKIRTDRLVTNSGA